MDVHSIIKSLESLTEYEQQQVFNFFEKSQYLILYHLKLKMLLRKVDLRQEKYVLIAKVMMYQEMKNTMVNNYI